MWEQAVRREGEELLRTYRRGGAARAAVNLLGPVVFSVNVSKTCVPTSANAVYFWHIRWEETQAPDRPENRNQRQAPDRPYNGEPRQNGEPRRNEEPRQKAAGGDRTMFRTMRFPCSTDGSGWRCP